MWTKSYSKTIKGLTARQIWSVWTDVNQWHTWQDDIEYAKLEGEFKQGNIFQFKPKGGPRINIELIKVETNCVFIDVTKFPLAKMYDSHEIIDRGDALEIKTTISIEGPLAFIWRKLVAENVANGAERQTERLLEKAKNA